MTDHPSEPTPSLGVRDRQREDTHRRLYECSLSVFRRDGFTNTKIDDIAKMAGVSRGTFYFHFPTKDDVLLELLRYVETRNAAAITSLPEDASVETILTSFCNSMADEWKSDPKLLADTPFKTNQNNFLPNEERKFTKHKISHTKTKIIKSKIVNY